MDLNNVIISPIITEKSMAAASKNKYTFLVSIKADKDQIKRAVEKKFNVKVLDISTVITKGRSVRTGIKRIEMPMTPMKKAIVTVKSGDKIALFDIKG